MDLYIVRNIGINVKLDNYLFTVPFLGLPVLGAILLTLILINAVNNLLKIFTTNGQKVTVENLVNGCCNQQCNQGRDCPLRKIK